jgi:hypothetical protein
MYDIILNMFIIEQHILDIVSQDKPFPTLNIKVAFSRLAQGGCCDLVEESENVVSR